MFAKFWKRIIQQLQQKIYPIPSGSHWDIFVLSQVIYFFHQVPLMTFQPSGRRISWKQKINWKSTKKAKNNEVRNVSRLKLVGYEWEMCSIHCKYWGTPLQTSTLTLNVTGYAHSHFNCSFDDDRLSVKVFVDGNKNYISLQNAPDFCCAKTAREVSAIFRP